MDSLRSSSSEYSLPFLALSYSRRALFLFSLMLAFVFLGDASMSYLAPVLINAHLQSAWLMGLVISTSSAVGLICDVVFAQWFAGRSFRFFIKFLFTIVLGFPLSMIFFPANVTTFVIAMAIWGIYFELIKFGQYNFIHAFLNPREHAMGWGMFATFMGLGVTVGPLLMGYVLDSGEKPALSIAALCYGVGLILWLLFSVLFPSKHTPIKKIVRAHHKKSRLMLEIKIWGLLMKKVWPLYIFLFALVLLDTGFWTAGALLSETLGSQYPWGHLILPAYILPSIVMALFAGKLANRWSKKRIAMVAGLIGSVLMAAACFFLGAMSLIVAVFVASIFISLAYPELYATFEDYISRLGSHNQKMIGLESSAPNVAYVIGPIIAGGAVSLLGAQRTLGVLALTVGIAAIIGLLVLPRKIKMPHTYT